ncbi:endonuclease-reverse transcriptase [Elysia marginata]|uniref:Endonuclease-reverse transcriptase n=1 Tax=Elysia marginata TaxID=1093978 RepID=A0AAV4FF41_9GAST|nr:endonuclease-reverse transcriptase [Elysia marginata]
MAWRSTRRRPMHIGRDTKALTMTVGNAVLERCYVFSVFNYSCEALTYSKTVQKNIQTFEMWRYRRLLKVPWTGKNNNKENYTNGRCRRKTVATYEAENWVS